MLQQELEKVLWRVDADGLTVISGNGAVVARAATPRYAELISRSQWMLISEMAANRKQSARRDVAHAVKSGKLRRQPCEVCGERAEAHHPDYAKPLDVRWLCRRHHPR